MKKLFIITLLLFSFVLIKAINNSSLPFGINVHLANNNILQKVKECGIKWIRIDALWANIELTKGRFSWQELDRVVNYAHQNGLSILVGMGGTPGWANNKKGQNHLPTNLNDWKNFVRSTVNRYKNKVGFWSVWNEPNNPTFFAKGKDVFMNKIFIPAAKIIRSNHGSGKIVGPDCAHFTSVGKEWFFWLKYILANGKNYIDIISHHIYKNEGPEYIFKTLQVGVDFLPSVQEIIKEEGCENKSFWLTETGWNTSDFTEDKQSDYYLEMLQRRHTENFPNKIFFYEVIDLNDASEWGILRSNLNKKIAYNTYKGYIDGDYPAGFDDQPEDENSTCYSENLQANNRDSISHQTLAKLRNLKNTLNFMSTSAKSLIKFYYKFSPELYSLTCRDPDLSNSAVKFINLITRELKKGTTEFLKNPIDKEILGELYKFINLIKKNHLTPSFRRFLNLAERETKRLNGNNLINYFEINFNKELLFYLNNINKLQIPLINRPIFNTLNKN